MTRASIGNPECAGCWETRDLSVGVVLGERWSGNAEQARQIDRAVGQTVSGHLAKLRAADIVR